MTIREKILLEGEDRASKAFDTAGGSFEKMGATLKKVAVAGGIAVAGRAVIQLGTQVTKMAIDAGEAEAAFQETFGQALPQASAFVDEFANKAGFATYELQQMLAVTGNVVQGIGATEAESAALAETMARLAGDVASFSNAEGGAQAVMLALQSAINGEREALKTYGLAISEAEVQERALANTQKTRADDLTRLEKAQATVEVATQKAGKAIGDLDRTQDSAANSIRRLEALAKDAGVAIGKELLPAVEAVLPLLEDMIPAAEDAGTAIAGAFTTAVLIGTQAVPAIVQGLSRLSEGFATVVSAGAGAAAIVGEVFSLGQADTTGLKAMRDVAKHAADIQDITSQLTRGFVPGADAATQYANALVELANRSNLSAQGIAALGSASGATAEQQLAALEQVQAFADANNWRPDNVLLLTNAIIDYQQAAGTLPDFSPELYRIQGGAEAAGDAVSGVTPKLTEAQEEMAKAKVKAQELADAFKEDLAEEAADFITGFEALPERIKTTMGEFAKNLHARDEELTTFWTGLVTLAQAGLTDLSEELRAQGPEAAGLVEDFVGDMEKAARLDEAISQAETDSEKLTAAYAGALEGSDAPTAMGNYGTLLMTELVAGINGVDVLGAIQDKVNGAVSAVTGTQVGGGGRVAGSGGGAGGITMGFAQGTWAVPGAGPVAAMVHGGEIVIPPGGSSGRAQFASELAAELGRVIGGGGPGKKVEVNIGEINVLVPAGTTVNEAITAGVAEAAIEAILS